MDEHTDDNTGALLRSWRLERGLSLETTAGALGCSRTTLERWENGRQSPRVSDIRKLDLAFPGAMRAILGLDELEAS